MIDAFLAAARRGDLTGLLTVLAPEVELHTQGPEGTYVVRGADQVAARAGTGARPEALARPVLVDGLPGVLIMVGGRPFTVMAFTVTDGAITAIHVLTDPDRLARAVPSWIA